MDSEAVSGAVDFVVRFQSVSVASQLLPMMQIKRKRRRHAVDPCLGFYSSDYSPQPVEATLFSSSTAFRLHSYNSTQPYGPPSNLLAPVPPSKSNAPAIQNLIDVSSCDSEKIVSSPPSDLSLVQVPVEEFLKQITRKKPLRKYGRQRRRMVETGSSSPSRDDDDLSPVSTRFKRHRTASTDHHCVSPSPSHLPPDISRKALLGPLRKTTKTKAKSLTERLYEASVMTHGNPADCLINPDILDGGPPFARSPLQFVAETPGLTEMKHRTWTLVDPKKALPFRSASFLSYRPLQDPERISVKPITRWRPRDSLESPHKRRKISSTTNKSPVKPLSCPPLSFIPFQDAEETYSLRLRSDKLSSTTLQLPSPVLDSEVATRTSLCFVTPLLTGNARDISKHYSSPSSRNILESSCPFLPTCPAPLQPSEGLISNSFTLDTPDQNVHTASGFPPSPSSPPSHILHKPLKPLASFFEGFLERGRHAEQIQSSIMPRSTRPTFKSTSYRRQSNIPQS